FWHQHEPSDPNERCVVLNFRKVPKRWGWNDVNCLGPQSDSSKICVMENCKGFFLIYFEMQFRLK
ncbi:T0128230 isoform 1, partial [Pongo abelii]